MALMRAARHAAIAVMALTASTHAAAQDVGTFNPDAPGTFIPLMRSKCRYRQSLHQQSCHSTPQSKYHCRAQDRHCVTPSAKTQWC